MRLRFLCVLLLLPVLTATLFAQGESATLSGTVLDQQSAPVVGAEVALLQPATGAKRAITTAAEGLFVFPFLPPGTYTITVNKTGFAERKEENLVLAVSDRRNLRIELALAGRQDSVSVSTALNPIQETSAVGTLVNQRFVENMPLNGRSFQSLISLTPGVVQTTATQRNPGQFSVNGQRTSSNAVMIDGVSANFGVMAAPIFSGAADGTMPAFTVAGSTSAMVSLDAMQEFQVQTSSFAPEFGRTPGGQISIVTRSGTNQYHGSLFHYFRNDKLDANDWFANRDNVSRAPLRQNNFGLTLGGPLHLGKVYDGHDRTFYFFSYEGLRLRQPQFAIDAYPTAAARATATPANAPLVNAYPLPNREDLGGGFGRFVAAFSNPLSTNATSLRMDHALTSRISLFGRFHEAPSDTTYRGPAQAYDLSLNTINRNVSNSRTFTFGSTQLLTPRLLNETRLNWSRNTADFTLSMDNLGGAVVPADSLLFPAFTSRDRGFIGILPAQIRGFAQGRLTLNEQHQWNLLDNFSYTVGRHQLKFGFDWRQLVPRVEGPLYQQFGVFVGLQGPVGLLQGRTTAALVAQSEGIRVRLMNASWYAQDTWRPNARLSVTFGLRQEWNPAPTGLDDRPIYTATGVEDPRTAALSAAGTPLFATKKNAFAPRFGASYLLTQTPGRELTLRGGYGFFYDLPLGSLQAATGNPPYRRTLRYGGTTFPLPAAQSQPAPITTSGRFDSVNAFAADFRLPLVHQFNLTLEKNLGLGRAITASYIGAIGRHLLRRETISQPRAFQTFDTLQISRSNATSDYHALQTNFMQRLRNGLNVMVSYTYAKSLDSNSDNVSLVLPTSVFPQNLNRGPSDFDLRQVFTGAISYDLPLKRNVLVKGWGLDTLFRAQSALPVDVINRTATLLGTYELRPNYVAGQPLYVEGAAYPGGRILNRAAFAVPTGQQTHGSLGRNVMRGFPLRQVDLTVRRDITITERTRLQLRAEAFNVLNHPAFGAPVGDLANRLFGASVQSYGRGLGQGGVNGGLNPLFSFGTPRSLQLAMKLFW